MADKCWMCGRNAMDLKAWAEENEKVDPENDGVLFIFNALEDGGNSLWPVPIYETEGRPPATANICPICEAIIRYFAKMEREESEES